METDFTLNTGYQVQPHGDLLPGQTRAEERRGGVKEEEETPTAGPPPALPDFSHTHALSGRFRVTHRTETSQMRSL